MNFRKLPLFKPTINMKASNPQFAIYGHFISITGGFFGIVSGFLQLNNEFIPALLGLLCGLVILMIELDTIQFPLLKEAQYRGVLWCIFGAISAFGLHFLAILLILVGGACYLVYDSQ